MRCRQCLSELNLICDQCYNSLNKQYEEAIQKDNQSLRISNQQIQAKHARHIEQFSKKTKEQAIAQRIKRLKMQISQMKEKLIQENEKKQSIMLMHEFHRDIAEQNNKEKQIDAKRLYLNELQKKNHKIQKQILLIKGEKLQVMKRIMEIYKFGWNRYFLKKWLKFAKIQTLIFTLSSQQKGIPVLVGQKQQHIVFNMQENEQLESSSPPLNVLMRMNEILYDNTRFAIFINEVLIDIRLPFKMIFSSKQHTIYIGKHKITLNYKKEKDTSQFLQTINCLQANMEYLYNAIGHEEEPILIIDNNFLSTLGQKQFQIHGFSNKVKEWKSNIKELGMNRIEDDEDYVGLINRDSSVVEQDDDIFQILQ